VKVTIENFREKLRVRWRYQGKSYCLSLGIEATPANKGYAKQIAQKVQGDILLGQFDETLVRYRPWKIGNDPAGLSCPKLFKFYSDAMKVDKGLVAGSLAKYQGCLSHIKTALNKPACDVTQRDAECFRAVLTERLSSSTVKAYLCHASKLLFMVSRTLQSTF
jgi:integrase